MLGRKTITLPTPPRTPSHSRACSVPSGMWASQAAVSQATPASIQSIGYCPMVNVIQKMNHRMATNAG